MLRGNPIHDQHGHGSIQVTLDLYSHVIPSLQEDAAARFAAVVDTPSDPEPDRREQDRPLAGTDDGAAADDRQ